MPRKRHVSRNVIVYMQSDAFRFVMPRKRHVSRNAKQVKPCDLIEVMPRKRHVSRNDQIILTDSNIFVMPRKRHVSRNGYKSYTTITKWESVMPRKRHVSRNGEDIPRVERRQVSCLARGM